MSGFFKVDTDVVEAAIAIQSEEAKAFSRPSGLYPVTIKVAYLTHSSKSEAAGMTVEYIGEGWKYPARETLWFQGRDGTTKRMAKKSDGGEYPDITFGMKQVNALAAVCGIDVSKVVTSDGVIEVKDGTKDVKVFAEFTGKSFVIGLQEARQDKYGEETTEETVQDVIWVGRSETDDAGFVYPWGNKTPVTKFLSTIAAEPTVDRREVSSGGAADIPEATGTGFGGAIPF